MRRGRVKNYGETDQKMTARRSKKWQRDRFKNDIATELKMTDRQNQNDRETE